MIQPEPIALATIKYQNARKSKNVTFIFIIAIAVVGWLLYTVHLKKMLQQGKSGKIKLALIALGLIFLALAVTGRAPALFAIIGAAMTQIMRIIPLLIRFSPVLGKFLGGTSGLGGFATGAHASPGASSVASATINLSLNPLSGAIDGKVLQGEFTGRALSSMSIDELKNLYLYCSQADPEAVRLLQTYIQRQRSAEWQQANPGAGHGPHQGGSPGAASDMSVEEARQILGLEGEITRKTISAAHRSLIGQFHPDKGGSDYLATKINLAREVLLGSLKT